jgi:hypothetical protein
MGACPSRLSKRRVANTGESPVLRVQVACGRGHPRLLWEGGLMAAAAPPMPQCLEVRAPPVGGCCGGGRAPSRGAGCISEPICSENHLKMSKFYKIKHV